MLWKKELIKHSELLLRAMYTRFLIIISSPYSRIMHTQQIEQVNMAKKSHRMFHWKAMEFEISKWV